MIDPSTFQFIADQRYFNMIIAKTKTSNIRHSSLENNHWRLINEKETQGNHVIFHFIYNSDHQYHRGEQEIFELKNNHLYQSDDNPNSLRFIYDCILILDKSLGVFYLLTPFVDILDQFRKHLIHSKVISKQYLVINLKALIERIFATSLVTQNLTLKTTSIGVSSTNVGNLSNIEIKGNMPLASDIGKIVLGLLGSKDTNTYSLENANESKVEGWSVSKCRIKSVLGRSEMTGRVNLSINIDKSGNFKLYLQKNGLNLFSLIAFIQYVENNMMTNYVNNNPMDRNILKP